MPIVRKSTVLISGDYGPRRCNAEPEVVKASFWLLLRSFWVPDFDIEETFSPKYRPWQQRLAFFRMADLFSGPSHPAAAQRRHR